MKGYIPLDAVTFNDHGEFEFTIPPGVDLDVMDFSKPPKATIEGICFYGALCIPWQFLRELEGSLKFYAEDKK